MLTLDAEDDSTHPKTSKRRPCAMTLSPSAMPLMDFPLVGVHFRGRQDRGRR